MEIKAEVRQLVPAQATLGEGALWDAGRQVAWFVDIKQHRVWHYDPANGSNGFSEAPNQVGWAIPATDGRLLCGLKDGLYTLDPTSDTFTKLMDVPGEPASNRANDACTDPEGRVFMGSMDDGEKAPTGRFYRFDRGTVVHAGPDQIPITNGPAVSGDGKLIYFTDSLGQKILVADLDAAGMPGPARLFVDTGKDFPEAFPDGPVVDSEGCLWTALWNGWCVARYSKEGKLLGKVKIPASNVTKMAFGGPDLKSVFVTTARAGLDEAALAKQPLAGSLFGFESSVAGYATARVKLA